jgi:replicative DNA helicase
VNLARIKSKDFRFPKRERCAIPKALGAIMNVAVQQVQFDPLSLFNIEIEQELLGAILNLGGSVLDAVDSTITSSDFYEPIHQTLFDRFSEAHARGRGINLSLAIGALGSDANLPLIKDVTVGQYIARLAASATVVSRAVDYAKVVFELAQRRKIVAVSELIQAGIAANHDSAEIAGIGIDALDEVASAQCGTATSRMDIGDAAQIAVERMQIALQNPGKLSGISTGLSDLDDKIGGLQRGELTILAGRPGMGKSAVGISICRSIAEAQIPSLYFSLEMGAPSLASRIISDICFDHRDPIEYFKIQKGELTSEQAEAVVAASRHLRDLPLRIDQQDGLTVSQIASRARKRNHYLARNSRRLGVVFIDHLHLIRPTSRYSGNRVGEVTEISGALKSLAKELDVAVVALAQLNRAVEARAIQRPTLADLRDSGSIEQDADTIIFLFREAYYLQHPISNDQAEDDKRIGRLMQVQNDLEANIAKQRSGPVGAVRLFCNIGANAIRNADRRR